MMRILVEGPKFSGKSTLVRYLGSAFPTSTRLEVRSFFNRTTGVDPNTKYYYPRDDTITTLTYFISAFNSIPETDEIIVERFHLFDWVQHSAARGGQPIPWDRYKAIDEDLARLKFKVILLVPPWKWLFARAKRATNQDIPIPHRILRIHRDLYLKATGFTKLPIFIMQKERVNLKQILSWTQI